MLSALEYLQHKGRMTKQCNIDCRDECPIFATFHGDDRFLQSCYSFETLAPEKYIDIVEKWAEGHPIKTRMTQFLEQYPNAIISTRDCLPDISPCDIGWAINGGDDCIHQDCTRCRQKYWDMPILDNEVNNNAYAMF